jgi:hypothetical protein
MLHREQGVGQVAEELLQQTGDAVDVVVEVLRIPKVELWRVRVCQIELVMIIHGQIVAGVLTRVKHVLQAIDMR